MAPATLFFMYLIGVLIVFSLGAATVILLDLCDEVRDWITQRKSHHRQLLAAKQAAMDAQREEIMQGWAARQQMVETIMTTALTTDQSRRPLP